MIKMKELKDLMIKLFRTEPYTIERYNLVKQIEQKENELKVYHYAYGLDIKNKKVIIDIQTKEDGLYKTIETYTIDNIKILERV